MYLVIIFLTLVSSILAGLFGTYIKYNFLSKLSLLSIISSMFLSFYIFYEVGFAQAPCYITLISWINLDLLDLYWGFVFDSLTIIMLVVITLISSLVHIYSLAYMQTDPHLPRFISFISLFTFFMLILITADNLLQMFVGWEGVGLCSYLLINFWFTRIEANKAAMKAIIVNRIGDFGLTFGILILFSLIKVLDFDTIFLLSPFLVDLPLTVWSYQFDLLNIICFFLFIGAIGKSAQIGLHTWLPDAMEGPTPVSALIHAATMVTAGIFLILRCSPLFELAPTILILITFIGALTAFFGATAGLLQNDLKKVIAYSTCSQLGYMVFTCGLSSYSVSLFHLMNHAFFKALLFLSAGVIIHAINDEQDMRKMGGFLKLFPFTYIMFILASLALTGFPFLAGFYSKDVLIELAFASYTIKGLFAWWLGTLTAYLTAFYSVRLLVLTFIVRTNTYKSFIYFIHEPTFFMTISLIVLAFGSLFSGYLTKDLLIGLGTSFWQNALMLFPIHNYFYIAEFLDESLKSVPLIFSISGSIFASIGYFIDFFRRGKLYLIVQLDKFIYSFFIQSWFFNKIYTNYIVKRFLDYSFRFTFQFLDRGVFELIGPFGFLYLSTFLLKNRNTIDMPQNRFEIFLFPFSLSLLLGLFIFLIPTLLTFVFLLLKDVITILSYISIFCVFLQFFIFFF